MDNPYFEKRKNLVISKHKAFLNQPNMVDYEWSNGIFERFQNPVLSPEHIPLTWRFDFNPASNPFFMERLGINAVFNAGAIEWNGDFLLVARVEGNDRKSFFAVAESKNGVDGFTFWEKPILLPETSDPDVNIYDMRLTRHEDGWIYGVFCSERRDPAASAGDYSSAIAQAGIVRTKDMKQWERLPDLKTSSAQQRNVVLHPEFINGKYAFYTRPQDSFIDTGKGGGIGWGVCDDITQAEIDDEIIIDKRAYHTIKEAKNGAGATPIKTKDGWLHIAHGVRNCAAGLRYVIYAFLCDLQHPEIAIRKPGGYLIAPEGKERVGDVSNVVFCNGAIARNNGDLYIYYASSDSRLHVAKTSIEIMLDYLHNTPEDGMRSRACVQQRLELIRKNDIYMNERGDI